MWIAGFDGINVFGIKGIGGKSSSLLLGLLEVFETVLGDWYRSLSIIKFLSYGEEFFQHFCHFFSFTNEKFYQIFIISRSILEKNYKLSKKLEWFLLITENYKFYLNKLSYLKI